MTFGVKFSRNALSPSAFAHAANISRKRNL
jgi:hypothetical protein